jgi:hypothetical protein
MKFKSKPEAYLYVLSYLNGLSIQLESVQYADVEKQYLQPIKAMLENHEQDPSHLIAVIGAFAEQFEKILPEQEMTKLHKIQQALKECSYQQIDEDRWENIVSRRVESQIQIELLQDPTPAMMKAVAQVSNKILDLLEKKDDLEQPFLETLAADYHFIAFGSFSEVPEAEQVKRILRDNKPADLHKIMHMHFKFARDIVCYTNKDLRQKNEDFDQRLFYSEHYRDRGRKGEIEEKYTHLMGIMVDNSRMANVDFPRSYPAWVSDSKAQAIDYASPFARCLIENDVPYVAGPSGMTARFIAQMLSFGDALNFAQRQSYVLSVTAYMVSAGFHSLHEVLWPIAICLPDEKLLPGYETDISKPANYNCFYRQMAAIDAEFNDRRDNAWVKVMDFFKNHYVRRCMPLKYRRYSSADRIIRRIKDEQTTKGIFDMIPLTTQQVRELANEISVSTTLTHLNLCDCRLTDDEYDILISALEKNVSVIDVLVDKGVDARISQRIENALRNRTSGFSDFNF